MKKLNLMPNVSIGSFVFGTEREEIRKIMKREFGSEPDQPVFDTDEDYANPNVQLEFTDEKLISVTFLDDYRNRYCEIYLGKEKIWPRTEKKFFSIFGQDSFVELYGSYYHTAFSLLPDWDENPPSLTIGMEGYCSELVDNLELYNPVSGMKKGMYRDDCRKVINHIYYVSDDGRSDSYQAGVIRPEVTSLTFDSGDNLIRACRTYPDGEAVNIGLQ